MARKESDLGLWIFSGVAVLFTWLVKRTIGVFIPAPVGDRPITTQRGVAERIRAAASVPSENVADLYEQLCVLDPYKHRDDPRIPSVLEKYRKVLKGKILDKDGQHMPSPRLEGEPNPDYATYIENQYKAFKRAGRLEEIAWIVKERKRVRHAGRVTDLRTQYAEVLRGLDVPEELLPLFLTDERINTFQPEDWQDLVRAVNGYLKNHEATAVQAFLQYVDDKAVLLDHEKMEQFAVFYGHGAPIPVIVELVRGRISIEQGVEMARLTEEEGYDWCEAFEEVIGETLEEAQTAQLREIHRSTVEKG